MRSIPPPEGTEPDAREIHDNVGHLLSRSILLAGAAKTVNRDETLSPTLDSLDQTLNAAMDNIRSSVHDLRDEAVNLDEAVKSLISDFTFCPVAYCYDAGREIPRDVKYSFISITKEALSNIMRHSNASKASVTIREHPALYQLCIEDNGTEVRKGTGNGKPPENAAHPGGMGLANMKERTDKLHGTIHISEENGFRILVTIPKRRPDMKLILIDDDCLVVSALKMILESEPDFEVAATAEDGSTALTLYRGHRPDVLLMDIRMKQKNGLDAAEEIPAGIPVGKDSAAYDIFRR